MGLRNTTFTLYVDWETVPIVGMLHRARRSFPGQKFPGQYFRTPAIKTRY
jgi:hypothetical protein